MHLDVQELQHFYDRTMLGHVVQHTLQQGLSTLMTPMAGHTVVGFGYTPPLMAPYLPIARRIINLMPGPQGVVAWPRQRGSDAATLDAPQGQVPEGAPLQNTSVLCEEVAWPLPTGFVDRLFVLHGLETSDSSGAVIAEANRVLGPGGRAVFIVPNRSGLWARHDGTPFGFGRSYSLRQLEWQLTDYDFCCERRLSSLFIPPAQSRFWLRTNNFWERFGQKAPWLVGGVFIVEAVKRHNLPQNGLHASIAKKSIQVFGGLVRPALQPN